MLAYMKARADIFSALSSAEDAIGELNGVKADPDCLSPAKVIKPDESAMLVQETGLNDLKQAILTWPFPPAPDTTLLLWQGELWWRKTPSKWKRVLAVITQDAFLHVLRGREEAADLLCSFPLRSSVITPYAQMEEYIVEIGP
jgi:hypothetical protein